MKRVFTKLASAALAAVMTMTCVPATDLGLIAPLRVEAAQSDSVNITEAQGWLETAWVEWDLVNGASSYKVYYKASTDSSYTQIDDMLLRKYSDHWRADILGLPAGSYTVKVSAFNASGSEMSSQEASVQVEAQERSGFAFKGTTTPGAYNADGSLKDGAQVIYFTDDDFATKQVTLNGKNGDTVTAVGYADVLKQLAYGYNVPTAIRIIGTISEDTYNSIGLSSEDCAEMKGLESGSNKSDPTIEVTIEGVGDDAAIGGGTCFNKASYCEMRNLAVGGFGDDGVAMKSATYMWIHNLDLMYGNAGSDTDQAKGDGSIDLKDDSQYVTISYVHFWDSGKCSLCGMKGESGPNYITYHHNWFDHSDSRHPRIRTMSVHIYNNYFDGNAKYGVGAANNSSAFVESNVFENCKHPMLSSMQGSDIMENEKTGEADFSGDGTFSGENGGIIKAYNNIIIGADSNEATGASEPVYYDASDTATNGAATQFDAYLASSRDEVVPSTVKGLQGGTTYDNETLAVGNLNATPEDVNTVKDTVTKYAGRVDGGTFEWTFTDADDTDSNVNQELKTAVLDYVNTIPYVSVGPNEDGSYEEPSTEVTTSDIEETTEATTSDSEDPTESTTQAPEEPTESTTVDPSGAASMGTYELGSGATGGDFNVTEDGVFGNIDFSGARSVDSSGVKLRSANSIKFSLSNEANITITLSGNAINITNGSGAVITTMDEGTHTYTLAPGAYQIVGATNSNSTLTRIVLEATGSSEPTTDSTTESTTEATTASTTESTTEATTESTTEATTQQPVEGDLVALDENTYSASNMLSDASRFTVTGNTSADQIKINESGSVVFKVNDNANVTITYKCGSSDSAKTASISCAGKTGAALAGNGGNGTLELTGLSAGEYTITATQTGGTTAQIISMTVSYSDTPEIVKGDANGDGLVNASDVTYILAYAVGKEATVDMSADVNDDGAVTVADAYIISKYVLGIIDTL